MVLQDWVFYGVIVIAALFFFAGIGIYIMIRNNAPDALEHWKAARTGDTICRVHYRGRKVNDYVAHQEKDDKEIGAPYWTVPTIGLKFKPEPEDIEFVEGSIPCVNYYTNMIEAIKLKQAVAFSQLKDYFKKIKMPINGIEDIAFYTSSENEKLNDKQRAMNNAKITSGETKKIIQNYLNTVDSHKKELADMKLSDGVFTWQTAMKSLDSIIAFTSVHFANSKITIEAVTKRKLENKEKDWQKFMFYAFMAVIIGVILLYALQGLNK